MILENLNIFIEMAKAKEARRIVVAAANEKYILKAIMQAYILKLIIPILVGNKKEIKLKAQEINFYLDEIQIIDIPDQIDAVHQSISIIKEGKADILMKGLIETADFMKAVLEKEEGLRKGIFLSHIAFFESIYYHKLFAVSDAALNIAPTFDEKIKIIMNAVEVYHKLGIENPKVAIIAATEIISAKMEATIHAAMLTMMNKRKQIKGCIIDGPFGLDNAISKEAATLKGIESDIPGDADIIITPDIEAGNILYKSLNFLGGNKCAAIVTGATVPIVLTSRADTEKSKLMSIALASLL